MRIHHSTSRAFTILELIVALGVTVLMLFMINALFTTTSDGVAVGMALSDVIGSGRAVSDQIERDAKEMNGPNNLVKGVMVIVCKKLADVPYMERRVEKTRTSARTDQVMWIRGRGKSTNAFGAMPIAPASEANFSSPTKTEIGSAEVIRVWYGHGLRTDVTGASVTALGAAGGNRVGNSWPLCRQSLFLVGGASAPAFNHAKGAAANAVVAGMTRPTGGAASLFHGLTDVAYLTYSGDPSTGPGAMISLQTGATGVYTNMLVAGASKVDYTTKALAHMFLDSPLWVNPLPRLDPADPVKASQIAQMHSLLMENVSDFIVEFAADITNEIDTNGPGGTDAIPDGTPDVDAAGEIKWYGLENNDASNSWACPDAWPSLGGGESPKTTLAGGGVAFVFRHDSPNQWPYMVRMRYRICDQRGDLLGDKSPEPDGTNVGKWFEQIIKVAR
jgi:hypothetical protein